MSLKVKIIIGVLVVAAGAAAYYFLVYKPKKDKEKASAAKLNESAPRPSKMEVLAAAGSLETSPVLNNEVQVQLG